MKSITKTFSEEIKEQIEKLSRDQTVYFAWLCAVRALPFLGMNGLFDYWPPGKSRNHLFSVFSAVDACSSYNKPYMLYSDSTCVNAFTAVYDLYAAEANEAAGEAAAYSAAHAARAAHAACANHAARANHAAHANHAACANHAAHANHAACAAQTADYSYNAWAAAFQAVRAVTQAAIAITATESTATESTVSAIAITATESTATESTVSASTAAKSTASASTERFEEILRCDIDAIKHNDLTKLDSDTGMYGGVWKNFLRGLDAIGCGYWARLYENLFRNKFAVDEEELQRRLSVPDNIKNLGAAAVGRWLDNTATAARNEVFISYSHTDEAHIKELNKYLKPLRSNYGIAIWYDQDIKPGDKWQETIRHHMSLARVAILMVSQDFLVSDFILNEELPELLQAAVDEKASIMWVPVSKSTVRDTHIKGKDGRKICIADYQAVCDIKKPLASMEKHERDEVYIRLYEEIKKRFDV